MRTRALVFSTFGLLLILAARQSRMSDADIHKPTALPDRVILTWSGDPATTQSVTWRTDTTVDRAVAQIAKAGDGPAFVKQARTVDAVTTPFQSDINTAHYHAARFTGLDPATLYAYRVGDGFNWSEWNQFRTASANPAPLEFLYVGDAQNDIYSLWSRLIRQGFSDAPRMNFIIHAGDLVNRSDQDALWGEWHAAAGWINRSVASFPTPGNHEYLAAKDGKRALTPNWRPQFTLPENGLPGLEETSYWLDIQGVRVVALNSNERHKEQAQWLDQLLSSNPNRWTVLTFHHPIYSSAKGRDNKELRDLWQPLFDKHGVDLVLTGHDHTYARTNLVTGAAARSGSGGTVYAVSVSGPKMYQLERVPRMQRAAEDTQLFQIIRIDGNRLTYEARTARGVLYDAFELRKRSRGRPNQFINRVPATPENRRPPEPAKAASE